MKLRFGVSRRLQPDDTVPLPERRGGQLRERTATHLRIESAEAEASRIAAQSLDVALDACGPAGADTRGRKTATPLAEGEVVGSERRRVERPEPAVDPALPERGRHRVGMR